MSGQVVIGVDGGNSKTDVVIVRGDGTLMAAVRGPGSSPHNLGLDRALGVVGELVAAAWNDIEPDQRNGAGADAATFFMAGADLAHEERALAAAIEKRGWAEHNEVGNDVFAILWAGTENGYGVAVTVGAGINCVGRSPAGRVARFPALGWITGDWGGGPDIGMAALGAAVRAEDGRGPATRLSHEVAAYFDCDTALDVAIAIHQGRLESGRLLHLPRLVVAAAEAGDSEAIAILDHQADEVVHLARAALRQLEMTESTVDVILGGSILVGSGPVLIERIRAGLVAHAPAARVAVCASPPVLGAVLASLRFTGPSDEAVARIHSSLEDHQIRPVKR
jgi:N-acetylglucosamine kinase-like BadF-type ATPase